MTDPNIQLPLSGRYILAVSGGADSMVLLDLMAGAAPTHRFELVVAHFDHGLRAGSGEDRRFVEKAATSHDLPFVYKEGRLGNASEAAARTARHTWLEQVRAEQGAAAVITAHHQDDQLETSLLNLARGTSRRGLAPMSGGPILRPLLSTSRGRLRTYAGTHKITWREDSTNADTTNPRNWLRRELLPHATPQWRSRYLELVASLVTLNTKIDQSISSMLEAARDGETAYSFPRVLMQNLSLPELEELLMSASLRLCPGVELDRRVVCEAALFAKTARPNKYRPLRKNLHVAVQTDSVRVYYMGISKVGRR